MNNYECLIDEAYEDGIETHELDFSSDRIKGLYYNGNIALNKRFTNVEKACYMAEELGHDKTSVGNILDLNKFENQKQERQARLWGYNKLIGLEGLVKAFDKGCQSRYEIADFLDVTEEFLDECIAYYTQKYGIYTIYKNYTICFIPFLTIGKNIKRWWLYGII